MKPLVLFSGGDEDADFLYATRFAVEECLYIRFGEGDELLVASPMEVGRAQAEGRVGRILDWDQAGWQEATYRPAAWAAVAARQLEGRGIRSVRVSPRLAAGYLEELRAAGVEAEVDRELFRAERRRKSREEASFVHAAQRAAEAACSEVVARLAVAEVKDGLLWQDGRPLTSERLLSRAQATLAEIGYANPDMIIAGSPGSAMPHYRGEGRIRAGAPVIVDTFPRGRTSHYHGDLTRTVVVGEISPDLKRMHETAVAALEAGIAQIKAGVNGRDVHLTVCRTLNEHGYGTATRGFEGPPGAARMSHSTGHGVGLSVHEPPMLRDLDYPLQEGDVVSVEPGLYLAGLGGVRVEDTGLVTRDGFQNFTTLTRSLDPRAYL